MEVELILSIVIAACTVIYTVINLLMLFESRATRKQKTTPFLVAFLKTTENNMTLALHIKNIGEGHATDVKIKMLKDFNQFNKNNFPLSEIGIVKNGFNYFPPQYELKYYIHSLTELDKVEDNFIELEISYKSKRKRFIKKYSLPFNQVLGQNYSSPPDTYIGQISHYLKEISKTIKTEK